MITRIIEAGSTAGNWGKFLVGRFDDEEWLLRSALLTVPSPISLLRQIGWGPEHLLVVDLQTGEGAVFRHGGFAPADLNKKKIWVCPLFEPFLTWLYRQDVADLGKLPALVTFTDVELQLRGYRRPGRGRQENDRTQPLPVVT